jgi:hypothetical protein
MKPDHHVFGHSDWVPLERLATFQEDHPTRPRKSNQHFKLYAKAIKEAKKEIRDAVLADEPCFTDRLTDMNNVCAICHTYGWHDGALRIICDGCNEEFHTHCLTPPLIHVRNRYKTYDAEEEEEDHNSHDDIE